MKKVLLASTALILTAGVAAADGHAGISLSGSANAGLKYNSDAANEITPHNEIDMTIAGAGSTDAGLEFGAFLVLDETGGLDDTEVFISGLFGTIAMGGVSPATDGFGIADVGFDGIGIDDVAEQYKNATAGADVHYSYSASGLTFAAAAEFGGSNSYSASINYASGAFSAGIGYVEDTDTSNPVDFDGDGTDDTTLPSNSTVTVAAGFSQGAFSVNAMYSDWSLGGQGYGVDASFTTGAATITAVYAHAEGASANPFTKGVGDAYGVGVSMPLGGGLSVAGGIGIIETNRITDNDGSITVADLGVTMSF